MLGTTQDKLNERGQAIAAYMRVCLAAGATPGFSVDANVSAGQLAQETNKLDTAKRAYEEALLVCGGGGCTVLGFCNNSMREKDWRCRKRGTQAT